MTSGLIVNNSFPTLIFSNFNEEYIPLFNTKLFNKLLWKCNKINRISLCRPLLNLNNFTLNHTITTIDFIRLYIKTLGRKNRKIYIFSREDREYRGGVL